MPKECSKCGRKATDKNVRSFVNSAWDGADVWRCNDIVACRKRVDRQAAKAAS